jgi:hypothetical protein
VVIAAGVSCRQQIGDLAGRVAIHPAEALAQRLRHEPEQRLTEELNMTGKRKSYFCRLF